MPPHSWAPKSKFTLRSPKSNVRLKQRAVGPGPVMDSTRFSSGASESQRRTNSELLLASESLLAPESSLASGSQHRSNLEAPAASESLSTPGSLSASEARSSSSPTSESQNPPQEAQLLSTPSSSQQDFKSTPSGSLPDSLRNLRPHRWTWLHKANQALSSIEAQFTENSVEFHPNYAYGTASAFGNYPLTSSTVCYWELRVPYIYGTSVMFGIGSLGTPIKLANQFDNLLGLNGSYGLSHKGILYHNEEERVYCKEFEENQEAVVGVYFNGPKRQLSYYYNGTGLGVAFEDLNLDEVMYPMVSSTARKCTFILQKQYSNADVTLRSICKRFVVEKLENSPIEHVHQLGLPSVISAEIEKEVEYQKRQQNTRLLAASQGKYRKRAAVPDEVLEISNKMMVHLLSNYRLDQIETMSFEGWADAYEGMRGWAL
ncbi:unnamed protein product [Bursaphelenchus okinawaensis]|uniref:B30.2/SPRY domain-containing protein n=1 Tax=Bursaphelenchus okinawaensis TaxID=465554 RepID=A0A811L378_9BILA|nr:unnamed protein product [Bursaphelenchus okinawaensis]CAG9115521.1 unnamed protein product [Bursaphelenchus okinawaensis]